MHSHSIIFFIALALITPVVAASQAVNVYSARQEALIKPLLDRFSQHTGIQVNLVTGKADTLLARLELEGENSPADILITTDAGRLHRAKVAGLLQKISSPYLSEAIPKNYRDDEGYWFGLSVRARVIITTKDKADKITTNSYESLASPTLRNNLCIRSSSNIYNQSLVASMIVAHGEDATLEWARDMVANFARAPTGGDRDQILALAGGLCDVAVVNTYYLAMMLSSDDKRHQEAANAITIIWPNQNNRGTHVNVSGVAITHAASNRDGATQAALKLIEHLASAPSQRWYASINNEYPVMPDIEISPVLKNWGTFKRDMLNLEKLGELNSMAVRLMDKSGWK